MYYKNSNNIGMTRNFIKVMEVSNGEYINLHSDDDFFYSNIIYEIINMINNNREYNVMYADPNECGLTIKKGEGINSYVEDLSQWITLISEIIIKNVECKKILDSSVVNHEYTNQINIQLKLLSDNSKYCILYGNIFRGDSGDGPPASYDYAEVFIKHYLDLLSKWKKYGLEEITLKKEKIKLLNIIIFPWLYRSARSNFELKFNMDIFKEYYCEEEYYNYLLDEMKKISVYKKDNRYFDS